MTEERQGSATLVELVHLEPQPALSLRTTVQIAALGEAMGGMLRTLADDLRRRGIQPASPPFVRYHAFGDRGADLELGVPVAGPTTGEGRITGGALPGGPAIATWHLGAHDKLGEAYARLRAWLAEHRRAPRGAAWEVYGWIDLRSPRGPESWPDASRWRTRLVQPIKDA